MLSFHDLRPAIGPLRLRPRLDFPGPGLESPSESSPGSLPKSPFETCDSLPVYGAGQTDLRRPLATLRWSPGENVLAASRRFHRGRFPEAVFDDGTRALEFRELLGRFVDLCKAVSRAERLTDDSHAGSESMVVGARGEVFFIDRAIADGTAGTCNAPAGPPEGPQSETGAQRNVYNLGVALRFVISGRWPLGRSRRAWADAEAIGRVGEVDAAGVADIDADVDSDVPAALDALCRRAMSPRPAERPECASALAAALDAWRDGPGLQVFYDLVRAATESGRG